MLPTTKTTSMTTMTSAMKTRTVIGIAGAAALVLAGASALAVAGEGGAGDFGPAIRVVEAGASNPTAALDGRAGHGYVAWVATADGASDVFLARVAGDAAEAPVRVNDRPGDAAPHEQAPAQVAVGPEGNVYVVWQNQTPVPGRRFPASDLRFARSTDGGRTFEPAVTVNDDAGGIPSSHTFHDVVVASDGTVWVSWLDSRVRDAERARRNPAPRAPSADSAKPMHGHGGGAKEDPTLPGGEIRVARSTDGGRTFGPSLVVDGGVCPCCRTSLAVAPDGGVYVAWRKVFAGDVRDVVVARLAPGAAAFGAPRRVHADGWVFPGCPHAGPSVAVDAGGTLHVGWYTGKEGRQGLWYASSDDRGTSFDAPKPILTGDWVPPSQVALAADADGVWISWDDRRTDAPAVSFARVDRGGVPRAVRSAAAGRSPALDARAGARLLAWHDGQSVRARMAPARE